MDALHVVLRVAVVLRFISPVSSTCLAGCSCTDDNLGRSLLCMDAAMDQVPENMPQSFTKIRIEKCHLTELPPASFPKLGTLEFLWLNFNEITVMNVRSLDGLSNLTELRLQGNKLSSVPWTAFQDTPRLKVLDLKHNGLDVLPEHALRHLPVLTYLDLSFNRLSIISKDVFVNWPLYQVAGKTWRKEGMVSNVVLALHDNPWLCDCRLKGFLEFIREVGPPVILMNSYLMCSSPASKAGRFFHETQLKTCTRPTASAPDPSVTLPLGENATLTCLVTARPRASIQWMYSLRLVRGFTALETHVDEDTSRSQLLIPSLHLADRGCYTCIASNFIGSSSVNLTVNIHSNYSAPPPPPVPMLSDNDAHVDIRIAKQTVYGIALEWVVTTENPADTWFTVHFGKYDSSQKEMIYISPGVSSYSFSDLLPVTKYEVCVSLRNHPPRQGECVVFVTGSDISELEQRQRLVHVIVIVLAMLLAIPVGLYACTTEARFSCLEPCVARLAGFSEKKKGKSEERCKGGSGAYLY